MHNEPKKENRFVDIIFVPRSTVLVHNIYPRITRKTMRGAGGWGGGGSPQTRRPQSSSAFMCPKPCFSLKQGHAYKFFLSICSSSEIFKSYWTTKIRTSLVVETQVDASTCAAMPLHTIYHKQLKNDEINKPYPLQLYIFNLHYCKLGRLWLAFIFSKSFYFGNSDRRKLILKVVTSEIGHTATNSEKLRKSDTIHDV